MEQARNELSALGEDYMCGFSEAHFYDFLKTFKVVYAPTRIKVDPQSTSFGSSKLLIKSV